MWIDSHCHLDAAEFDADRDAVREAAKHAGVGICVIPAVQCANFASVQELAHRHDDIYALGIHPLYVPQATDDDLIVLERSIAQALLDKRFVAVGEIGLDYFVPDLCTAEMREKQWHFYTAQIKLAKRYQLPIILHARRSADMLLKGIRQVAFTHGGISHAFNGSFQQAQLFIDLGFKLGFGGTLTYERSLQIRRLATELPLESIVLETDAPDISPEWLYKSAQKNNPSELPHIGSILAELRGITIKDVAHRTSQNVKNLFSRFFLN